MSRFRIALGLIATMLVSSGCLGGAFYTHVTQPFDTNFDETPSFIDRPVSPGPLPERPGATWKTLVLPTQYFIGFDLSFDWGETSVAQAIADTGFETVHYADLEEWSVLGVWTERRLHVYGE